MPANTLSSEELHASTQSWWLFLLAGLVSIAAGVIVLLKPSNSLATLAVIAGILVLVEGAFDLVASARSRTEYRGLAALLGVVSVVVGVLLIRHPIHGVLAIALLIGIWLIAAGVVRMVRAFDGDHRLWRVVAAVVEIAAGIVIVSSPPIGFATLALLTGISFIVSGVSIFALGWTMHMLRQDAASTTLSGGQLA